MTTYNINGDVPQVILELSREIESLTSQLRGCRIENERLSNRLEHGIRDLEESRNDVAMLKDTVTVLCSMIHKQGS